MDKGEMGGEVGGETAEVEGMEGAWGAVEGAGGEGVEVEWAGNSQ